MTNVIAITETEQATRFGSLDPTLRYPAGGL